VITLKWDDKQNTNSNIKKNILLILSILSDTNY
jgi:hypothetical protein